MSEAWMHKVESWDHLSGHPEGTYVVIEEPIDPELDLRVPVTSEQAVRWEGAWRTWIATQQAMGALYERAEQVAAAAEEIAEAAQEAVEREEDRDNEILATISEVETELRDGPREWAMVSRRVEALRSNQSDPERGRTIHHINCRYLKTVRPPSYVYEPHMRFPEAVAELTKPRAWGGVEMLVAACKVCAKRISDEVPQPAEEEQ